MIIAAKKYARCFTQNADKEELVEINSIFTALSQMFKEQRFKDTLLSPLVSAEEKIAMIIGGDAKRGRVANFIHLLIEKRRLALIPKIATYIKQMTAEKEGKYIGYVYCSVTPEKTIIADIEKNLNRRLGYNVELEPIKEEIDGFRVEVPNLGIEVSFSQEKLKNDVIAYILKGI